MTKVPSGEGDRGKHVAMNAWPRLLPAGVRRGLGLASVVGTLLLLASNAYATPPASISYYEMNANTTTLHSQGCAVANQAYTDAVVILDYGQPAVSAGVYGQLDFSGQFVSFAALLTAFEAFSNGYHDCYGTTGNVEIVWGTNNYKLDTLAGVNYTTFGGDQGSEVSTYNVWRSNQAYNKQAIFGGIDAEIGVSWGGSYANTLPIATAYNSHSVQKYLDFGDDAGGPCTTSCGGNWTTANVYNIAFGLNLDWPMPEIYVQGQATLDWVPTETASVASGKVAMYFWGTLSTTHAGYYTPSQSWNELQSTLTSAGFGSDLGDGLSNIQSS